MLALLFPGQGSQKIGMGAELAASFAEAAAVFQEVDDALAQNLSQIIWHGSPEELTLTENAQPALMATSIAALRALQACGFRLADETRFVAGHSLGEYSALCAAGALSLADTARLLRLRGQAMQRAVPVGEGAMAALLGLTIEESETVVQEAAHGEILQAANDNAPGQVVISGSKQAVERACILAREHGCKRAVILPVSAPFHCSLMQPAAEEMQKALSSTKINEPCVPIVANVTARAVSNPEAIRQNLVKQICGRVRWRESISWMVEQGVTSTVELGSGNVLSGIARRIERSLAVTTVGDEQEVKDFQIGAEK